jgi:CRP-like cAMP-binding protein
MNLLIQHIGRHVVLTKEDEVYILQAFAARHLKKKEMLIEPGHAIQDAAFVLSGCLRAFTVDEQGHDHTLQFSPADWWMTDFPSFITEQPGQQYVEAIEDSDVVILSRKCQLQLFNDVPALERYFRIITENALVASQLRVVHSMELTAQQRYVAFCKKYPMLVDRIAQKYIAGYIGVTPEFLSKMRAEMLRKQK